MSTAIHFGRTSAFVIALSFAAAAPASAHIKLEAPTSWIVENSLGDPQKTGPCGTTGGQKTNAVLSVKAGSKLVIKWTETVPHPGHFRISLAADRAQFKDPVTVVQNNDCKSAAIQAMPVAPVLADGLFVHGDDVSAGAKYEHEITVPNTPCEKCTIQVLQFMSKHAPGCFYYHCADIKITEGAIPAADAGVDAKPATAMDAGVDAAAGSSGSGGSAGSSGAGGTGGTGGSIAGTSGSAGSAGTTSAPKRDAGAAGSGGAAPDPGHVDHGDGAKSGGCAMAGGGSSAGGAFVLAALVMMWRRRRARS